MKPLPVGQTAVLAAKLYLVKGNIRIFEEYRRICTVLRISGISKGNVERVVGAVIFEGSWYEGKGFYAAGRILTGSAGKDNRKFIAATSAEDGIFRKSSLQASCKARSPAAWP